MSNPFIREPMVSLESFNHAIDQAILAELEIEDLKSEIKRLRKQAAPHVVYPELPSATSWLGLSG